MSITTDAFDQKLSAIDHFVKYPEMLPHVGVDFQGDGHKKLLLIAESNYLPPESTVHLTAQLWYDGTSADLSEDERNWIHCRNLVAYKTEIVRWKKGHAIYGNLENALVKAGAKQRANMFSMVAYMNCFQRPAKRGASLIVGDQDILVSKEVVGSVIAILQPEMVCFVSSKAWGYVGLGLDRASAEFACTPHPCSTWWNRKSKHGSSGREAFIAFARKWLAS